MRTGFVVPYAAEREFADLARLGEERGWDAVFGWEALYGIDAWVQLGAAAMVTERIRLGTLLTPASRHRPWDLASSVGSVDRISGGRAIMTVGLGALHPGWTAFEPDEGRAVRAAKLDEGLAIWAGLLEDAGSFTFEGRHYSAGANDFMLPPPTPQRPHPPVWVVGAPTPGGGRQRSLERAARWQGVVPAIHPPQDGAPKSLEDFAAVVDAGAPDPWRAGAAVGGLRRRHRGRLVGVVHLARAGRADGVGAGRCDVVGRELVGRAAGTRRARRGAAPRRGRPAAALLTCG